MTIAFGVAIVLARQVQTARSDREIELELAQEAAELRGIARQGNPQTGAPYGSDVRALFNTYFDSHVAGDHEAFYTIPLDGDPGEGRRYSFGAPPELLEDAELVRAWSSVDEATMATADSPAGDIRYLAVPILAPANLAAPSLEVADSSRPGTDADVIGVFVAAHFLDFHREELNELVRLLVLAGLVVLVVTSTLTWFLAGRVIAPVRQLTRTARAITHSDLSARIPVEGRNELSELGTTFNEMVDRLDTGFRAQRQFLDDIAHDLRTPITIARGHLEVLGDDPAEREETVSVVLDELDRMGRSVSDLLVLAKAEQPDFLRLQTVDYGDFAPVLMQRVSRLADRTWKLDEAPAPGRVAGLADVDRLLQAMLNLVVNAVQHTAAGDEIGLGVATDPSGSVRMWVRDRGPGIGDAEASVLFQRYGKGQSQSSRDGRQHDGMGLGLSIVDAITRAHGGTVSHVPTPGGGATFTIVIPLEPQVNVSPVESDER